MQNISEEIAKDNSFNIVGILLIDHAYLRECIEVILNDEADKHQKLFFARTFLDTLTKHSAAEEKTVYDSLIDMDELHAKVLECEVEHAIVERMISTLWPRMARLKDLDDVTEAEIRTLAKIVRNHIDEEERTLFPLIKENLDQSILNEIGFQFMILRRFTPQDLENYPELQKEIYYNSCNSKRNIYQWSGDFVKKVNRYIGAIVSQSPYFIKT
ncbi:hemerythrin-like domain-containing protein [Bacteriovorax stolpii]|nr:hemerythrin domain-containing protein [Bacteriovorax stolpii]TDP55314.1 hemerythrin-like domain-containing protein [Bacteriovorax stolpii]